MESYLTEEGRKRYTIKPFEYELSFDKGFYVFIRSIQLLTSHNNGTILVGLAGPSGSGKTAFSEKVRSFLPGVCVISMDNYNDGSKVIDSNFDDPRVTDYDLLLKNIKDLKAGKDIQMPIYDFKKSQRVGFKEVKVPSSRVVIVEGIYALHERLRKYLDLRVSITGGIHFDLVKRVLRDLDRSGLQADQIIQQISDTVYPMYKAFIEPDLKTAQLKVYNKFNPFSGFICHPTYILKSKIELSTGKLLTVLNPKTVQRKETEIVDIYLLPPNEDPEQCCSWLRMRTRDGRYSLMFEEWVTEVPFVISPRISFEVSARILGGLMALGYEMGPILQRKSIVHSDGTLSIKQDTIEKLGKFTQIHGNDRAKVSEAGKKLGLEGSYIPRSYIEQVQLENLIAELKTEDVSKRLGLERHSLPRQISLDATQYSETIGTDTRPLTNSKLAGILHEGRKRSDRSVAFSNVGKSKEGQVVANGHEHSTLGDGAEIVDASFKMEDAKRNVFEDDRLIQKFEDLIQGVHALTDAVNQWSKKAEMLQFMITAVLGFVLFGTGCLIGAFYQRE